jgi:UDP-sulfoquinovose synthase
MRILIAGVDGYLGWPLAQHLAIRGHVVGGIDNGLRRRLVAEAGSISAIPIATMDERQKAFYEHFGTSLSYYAVNLLDYEALVHALHDFQPDAVVHLAEIPSAPYSMRGPAESVFTQQNNVLGSLNLLWAMKEEAPDAHLLKLGTMGEYGTPNVDIPEGFFEIDFRGRRDVLPFPRQAGSFYHWSKVHDSNNIMFACRIWGLSATDVMQGIVYGTWYSAQSDDFRLATRFDFDSEFGTIINRFCCQAIIHHPLSVYGHGGQQRSFLPIQDSIQCMTLALEQPPKKGEYRVLNQFDRFMSIAELATLVRQSALQLGIDVQVTNHENPRNEVENHYYNPDRNLLRDLGYQPHHDPSELTRSMMECLIPWKNRVEAHHKVLMPNIQWDGSHRATSKLNTKGNTV